MLAGGGSLVSLLLDLALASLGVVRKAVSTGMGPEMVLPWRLATNCFDEASVLPFPTDEDEESGVIVTVITDADGKGDELLVVLVSGKVAAESTDGMS